MKLSLIASIASCFLIRSVLTIRHSGVLDNGLAQPRIEHVPKESQLAPRCTIKGKPMNLLFILDSSGSLNDKFEEERQVVIDILNTVSIHADYTRVALIQYSGIARTEFNFDIFKSTNPEINRRNAIEAVKQLRFINGITKTGNALQHAKTLLTPSEGWRSNVKTIIFLVSDGRTYDNPRNLDETMARQLKSIPNVDIFSYGTGEYVAIEELIDITGSDQKVFSKSRQPQVKVHEAEMLQFFQEWKGEEVCVPAPLCIPGSDRPVDLMFVLDGSGSLEERFYEQIKFLHRIIAPINVHPEAVRVSLIQYASAPRVEFKLMKYHNAKAVEDALDRIRYMSGSTDTNAALDMAAQQLSHDDGRRPAAETVVVVLTDGHARFAPNQAASRLLSTADYVYAVAVNNLDLVDGIELQMVTQDWNRVYTRTNLTEFETVLNKHFSFSCPGQGNSKDDFEPVVRGPVQVTCSSNRVSVTIQTRNKFEGRMYAARFYDTPGCFTMGSNSGSSVRLDLNTDNCGIKRTVESNGYKHEGVVLVQFHPNAVTKVDQILDISCFHQDNSAQSRFGELNLKFPSECQYHVRKFAPNGCVALDARVGEGLYHTWKCDNDPVQYGFLVHSCVVEGNDNSRIQLSDKNGCPIDNALFATATYMKGNQAYAESSSFRLPKADNMRFKCKISMCDRAVGGCDYIVPPVCNNRGKRGAPQRSLGGLPTFDVQTRWINVMDGEEFKPDEPMHYCNGF